MFFWDSTFLLIIPALILSIYAQAKVRTTFARYSKVPNASGLTGSEAARIVLDGQGLSQVPIRMVRGTLSDHFDPRDNSLNLSPEVYEGRSVAALGVACHEAGHAVQFAGRYVPLRVRAALVPVAGFASNGAMILFFIGLIAGFRALMDVAIIAFTGAVAFYVVTLPVEFNASRRALQMLAGTGIVSADEAPAVKRVLGAAGLTYLAAALMAVMTLIRLLVLRDRR